MRIKHPFAKPRHRRRAEWDDYDMDHPLILDNITVYEEDEVLHEVSPLVDQYGFPIIHEYDSEKQGFIGFISPETLDSTNEAEDEDDEAEEE